MCQVRAALTLVSQKAEPETHSSRGSSFLGGDPRGARVKNSKSKAKKEGSPNKDALFILFIFKRFTYLF